VSSFGLGGELDVVVEVDRAVEQVGQAADENVAGQSGHARHQADHAGRRVDDAGRADSREPDVARLDVRGRQRPDHGGREYVGRFRTAHTRVELRDAGRRSGGGQVRDGDPELLRTDRHPENEARLGAEPHQLSRAAGAAGVAFRCAELHQALGGERVQRAGDSLPGQSDGLGERGHAHARLGAQSTQDGGGVDLTHHLRAGGDELLHGATVALVMDGTKVIRRTL
jgi:hypothetical protein